MCSIDTVTVKIIVNGRNPQFEFDIGIFGRVTALAHPCDLDKDRRNGAVEKREFIRGMQERKMKET